MNSHASLPAQVSNPNSNPNSDSHSKLQPSATRSARCALALTSSLASCALLLGACGGGESKTGMTTDTIREPKSDGGAAMDDGGDDDPGKLFVDGSVRLPDGALNPDAAFNWDASTAIDAGDVNLAGALVTFTARYPDVKTIVSEPLTATVGSAVEFPSIEDSVVSELRGLARADVNLGAAVIDIRYRQLPGLIAAEATFNGYVFDFSQAGLPPIQDAFLGDDTNFAPDTIEVTFDEQNVYVNLKQQRLEFGGRILVVVDL